MDAKIYPERWGIMMVKTWAEISESYDFNRAALAKQRLQNLRHAGRKVRGARIANLLRAAGIHENTEIDEELITQLDEVLSKDTSVDKWIHDFVHSTNPKFEGKSKKERIKMALAAYYTKQRNEEEELQEDIWSIANTKTGQVYHYSSIQLTVAMKL